LQEESPLGELGRKILAGGCWLIGGAFVLAGLDYGLQFAKVFFLSGGTGAGPRELLTLAGSLAILVIGANGASVSSSLYSGREGGMGRLGTTVSLYLLTLGGFGIATGAGQYAVLGPFLGAVLVAGVTGFNHLRKRWAAFVSGTLMFTFSASMLLDASYSGGSIFGLDEGGALHGAGLFFAWRPMELLAVALMGGALMTRAREISSRVLSRASLAAYSLGLLIVFYPVPNRYHAPRRR